MFAVIVYYNKPEKPENLWEEFKDDLSDDFRRSRDRNDSVQEVDHHKALRQIANLFESFSGGTKTLSDYNMPIPPTIAETLTEVNREVEQAKLNINIADMNTDQRNAYETIIAAIENRAVHDSQKHFFINAPGGTGKTFILNCNNCK